MVAAMTLLLAAAESCLAADGLDPAKALTQYGLDTWTTDQGLPNATVNSILQGRDGYVWLATYDGLARFEGSRFKVFSQADGLGNNGIRALCQDGKGEIWVGTNGGGLARWNGHSFARVTERDGLPSDIVLSLLMDRTNGGLWIGTNGGGLARYREGRIERFAIEDSGRAVSGIAETTDGMLWLAVQSQGLRRRAPDGSFTSFSAAEGIPQSPVTAVIATRDGGLFGGTAGSGLFRFENGRLAPLPEGLAQLGSANISALLEDEAGTLWIGTNGRGLARWANGQLSFLGSRDGVGDVIYALASGAGGTLWIGTNGAGANRLRDGNFTAFTAREGLSRDFVYTSFEDRSGTLWAGTAGGLDRLEGGRFVPSSLPVGRPIGVRSIAESPDGSLWVATYGAGVWRLAEGRWQGYSSRDGLAGDNIRAILVDQTGHVWAAGVAGLSVFDGKFWKSFGVPDGLPLASLIGLAQDGDGSLWIGTDGSGLVRRRNGRFETFTTRNGLASNLILALLIDSKGVLWAGTNGGLSRRVADGKFLSFTSANGLPSDSVTQIRDDSFGDLWLGTSRGVSRVRRRSTEGSISPVLDIDNFDRLDGLKSNQCTAPGQPAGMRMRDGRLWFATARGYAVVDPASVRIDTRPPLIVLEEVLVDGRPVAFEDGIDVPPGAARIEFGYATLSALGPARASVRFRLDGLDADWVDAGGRQRAVYTSVPPGTYVFRAVGRTGKGPWSLTGTSVDVRVHPRFHQTRTFAILCALFIASLVTAGYRLRVRGLRAREQRLTSLVEERTQGLATEKERAEQLARDNALLFEREHSARETAERLQAATRALSTTIDRRTVIDLILVELQKVVPSDSASIQELKDGKLEIIAGSGRAAAFVGHIFDPAAGDGRSLEVLEKRHPVIRDAGSYSDGAFEQSSTSNTRSWLGVPLLFGERLIGMLAMHRRELGFYTPRKAELAMAFASQAAVAIENARLYGAAQDELAERARAEAALRESEERFRQLAENIDAAFFMRAVEPPALIYMSPAFERIWGRVITQDVGEFFESVHPADREMLVLSFSHQDRGYDVEYRIQRPDGSLRWIRSRTFPIVNALGRVDRVAGIAEDITVRKSVEQMREDLTHTLVHDLRNPLTSIQASIEMLGVSLGPAISTRQAEMLRLARVGSVKLLSLVNAILDVSRLEEGSMPLNLEPVDLSTVTAEILELQRPLALPRAISLINDIPADIPRVMADRGLLGRVIQNLVGNSIKFTPAGKEVRIFASLGGDSEGMVRVDVTDEGPGIPLELRERLFEKFVTGGHRASGSGLGLLFCRLAVEAHGGSIRAENRSTGACFTFTVPVAQ